MDQEQKYLFDLQGYIVLEQIVPPEMVAACNAALDRFEAMDPGGLPTAVGIGPGAHAGKPLHFEYHGGRRRIPAAYGTFRIAGCRGMRYRRTVSSKPHVHDLSMGRGLHGDAHARHAHPPQMPVSLPHGTDRWCRR